MSQDHETHLAVRRIVLPSGRTIEVLRYEETPEQARDLQVCPACDSHLVQPVSWHECRDGRCQITLECPNCGRLENGTYARQQADVLEDQLDEGLTQMISDLQRLTAANMAAEADRFAAALDSNLILPEDF